MDAITGSLGKDDFLRLFTTQLKNQDPLNPMDSTGFTAQLAQFSSLEQLFNMNKSLGSLLSYQSSLNNAMSTDLIGRTVRVDGSSVALKGTADLGFTLGGAAANAEITIYDAGGKKVKTVNIGPQDSGVRSFRWDGTDDDGKTMPDGTYTFSVQAIDGTGSAVTATTSVTGTVVGVNFKDGLTRLILNNGNEVSLSNVTEIYQQGGA